VLTIENPDNVLQLTFRKRGDSKDVGLWEQAIENAIFCSENNLRAVDIVKRENGLDKLLRNARIRTVIKISQYFD